MALSQRKFEKYTVRSSKANDKCLNGQLRATETYRPAYLQSLHTKSVTGESAQKCVENISSFIKIYMGLCRQ